MTLGSYGPDKATADHRHTEKQTDMVIPVTSIPSLWGYTPPPLPLPQTSLGVVYNDSISIY